MRNSGNINRPFVRFAIPDPRDPVARAFLIASDILEFLKHEAEQTLSLNPEDEMDISAAAEDIDRLGPACIANVLVPSKTASKTPLYNYNCPLQLLRID